MSRLEPFRPSPARPWDRARVSHLLRRERERGGGGRGAAAPLLLAGPRCVPGIHGPAPDLADLDERGDLRAAVDFREIYAAVLQGILALDPADSTIRRAAPYRATPWLRRESR